MNYFLAQGSLSMLAWHDMLVAAVYARNRLPHPQSRRVELRTRLATGEG
jgi:HAMP domain-containing protein